MLYTHTIIFYLSSIEGFVVFAKSVQSLLAGWLCSWTWASLSWSLQFHSCATQTRRGEAVRWQAVVLTLCICWWTLSLWFLWCTLWEAAMCLRMWRGVTLRSLLPFWSSGWVRVHWLELCSLIAHWLNSYSFFFGYSSAKRQMPINISNDRCNTYLEGFSSPFPFLSSSLYTGFVKLSSILMHSIPVHCQYTHVLFCIPFSLGLLCVTLIKYGIIWNGVVTIGSRVTPDSTECTS